MLRVEKLIEKEKRSWQTKAPETHRKLARIMMRHGVNKVRFIFWHDHTTYKLVLRHCGQTTRPIVVYKANAKLYEPLLPLEVEKAAIKWLLEETS